MRIIGNNRGIQEPQKWTLQSTLHHVTLLFLGFLTLKSTHAEQSSPTKMDPSWSIDIVTLPTFLFQQKILRHCLHRMLQMCLTKKQPGESDGKGPQMVKSDALLLFIGNCIAADPDKWGIMLTTKHGKNGAQTKFIDFLTKHCKSPYQWQVNLWGDSFQVEPMEARGAANGSMPDLCSE